MGCILLHTPPGLRKSGIPDSVLMPAPVKKTALRLACRSLAKEAIGSTGAAVMRGLCRRAPDSASRREASACCLELNFCQRSGLGVAALQNQLAFLHRNAFAGMMVHPHRRRLFAEPVLDVVADDFLAAVVHRLALRFRSGVRVSLLHPLLHLVARVAAGRRACDGCDLFTVAA